MTITPQHKQAAAKVAALLEARIASKAVPEPSGRPWTALELAFYTALRKILGDEARELAAAVLRDGAAMVNNPTWWTLHEATMIDELTNSMAQVARLGAQAGRAALGEPSIGVNWGLVNRSAVDWAEQNAGALVRQIEPVTRLGVRQAVAEWSASGEPIAKLAERIQALTGESGASVFSPARARRIAQTESTNAYAAGNVLAWEAAGVKPAAYKPAAHVNCRCWLHPLRMPDGTTVMRWATAEDERVCVQPLRTPWGEVKGCQELDNVIVSWGPYLGQRV